MFSAAGGSLSTAQILLGRGADPNALSACDITAFDVATICNRTDISNCLQERTSHHKKKGNLFPSSLLLFFSLSAYNTAGYLNIYATLVLIDNIRLQECPPTSNTKSF